MTTYEAVFILDCKLVEDGGEAFSQEVAKHIRSLGGRVQQRVSMGRRQFARAIGKHKAGNYWDFVFDLDPAKVAAFKDKYRLNSTVLRLQAVLYEAPPVQEKQERTERPSVPSAS